MARRADDVGLDFLMPIARWKGIPGDVNQRLHSFETLTHAAALASATRRVAIFSTVHTPIVHPMFAAKAMVTIDHASHGRAGLNIVCGWNQSDFDMFGFQQLPHDERYAQGSEWFEIWSRLVAGASEEFDFDGKYFPGLKGLSGMPPSLQRPHPVVLSAGYSGAGRDFAARSADYLLTVLSDLEKSRGELADVRARAAALGRNRPLGTIAVTYVVCRKTRTEAEAFHRYYAEEQADERGVDYYLATRSPNAEMPKELYRELRIRFAGGNAGYPLVGTPDDIAEELARIHTAGYDGVALCFLHYLDEVELFYGEVLPRLAARGLRNAVATP